MNKVKIGASTNSVGPAGQKQKVPPDKNKTNKPAEPQQPTSTKRKKSTTNTGANKKPAAAPDRDTRWSRSTVRHNSPDPDLNMCESDASGVISDAESEDLFASNAAITLASQTDSISNLPSTASCEQHLFNKNYEITTDNNNNQQDIIHTSNPANGSQSNLTRTQKSARVDLTKLHKNDIPSNAKQIVLSSLSDTPKLTSYNPVKIKRAIDMLCGEVENLEYLRSGNLMITVKNEDQLQKILDANNLPIINIAISASIAWTRLFSYGKIYAPELANDSLPELLEMLSPFQVVSIRKLFADPKKAHVPLYVLTFIGPAPASLKLGYVSYKVDTYYPAPTQCRKCWRLRHPTKECRSLETCSNCSATDHKSDTCTQLPKCINCKGPHASISQLCPIFQKEKQICTIKADRNISYAQARNELGTANLSNRSANQFSTLQASHISETQYSSSQNTCLTNPSVITPYQRQKARDTNDNQSEEFPLLPSMQSIISPIPPTMKSYATMTQSNIAPQKENPIPKKTAFQEHIDSLRLSQLPPSLPFIGSPSQQSLPYCIPSTENNSEPAKNASSNSQSCSCPASKSQQFNMQEIMPKLLPLLIKLFLSSSLTDKIESLTEIGQIFKLDDIVTSTIGSLHLSTTNQNGS